MTTVSDPVEATRPRAITTQYTLSRDKILYGGLLALTAIAYLWGLSKNGYANEYYAAAVQAGSKSWKAWFFGSFDSSSFITVDKTPGSLWVMGLSARIFGFNSWSMLVPEALMGVASVGFVYVSVRRWFSANAGLLAGAILALTPVAVLMFRFNNPDALLVLLLCAGAWAVTRAIDSTKYAARWMILAGALVGFGFLTKMLQAFLILPAFGIAYLVAGKPALGRRILHLVLATVSLIVSAGWWVAIVELLPASARPYIGGSQNNSILELTLGYNGLGRLDGNETGSVGGGGGGGGAMWGGAAGVQRLFGGEFASQIAWLLPAALLGIVVLVVAAGKAPRTDRKRAFALLWGGWLLGTGLVFSYMQGIIHSYYMIALAPAIGAVIGGAMSVVWKRRAELLTRATLAGGILLTAGWSFALLHQTSSWQPWLRWVVLFTGVLAAGLLVLLPELKLNRTATRRAGLFAAAVMTLTALAGPTAYSVATINSAHTGALPSAGPAGVAGMGRMGGFGGGPGGGMGTPPGQTGTGTGGTGTGTGGTGTGTGGTGTGATGTGGTGTGGTGTGGTGTGAAGSGTGGMATGGTGAGGTGTGTSGTGTGGTGSTRQGGMGGVGGFLGGGGISGVSSELITLLQQGAKGYTWAAAAVTANGAAPMQIASGEPIMAIGGFNGTDPAPTLAEFKQLVAQGKIHYFIGTGGGIGFGGRGGSDGTSTQIATWVSENFSAQTVGTTTVYDLSTAKGA